MLWGVILEPGQPFTQRMENEVQLSMAALETRNKQGDKSCDYSQVMIKNHDKVEYILCTLAPGMVLQQNLDLKISCGEQITISVHGTSRVYLTGYSSFEDCQEYCQVEEELSEQPHELSPDRYEHGEAAEQSHHYHLTETGPEVGNQSYAGQQEDDDDDPKEEESGGGWSEDHEIKVEMSETEIELRLVHGPAYDDTDRRQSANYNNDEALSLVCENRKNSDTTVPTASKKQPEDISEVVNQSNVIHQHHQTPLVVPQFHRSISGVRAKLSNNSSIAPSFSQDLAANAQGDQEMETLEYNSGIIRSTSLSKKRFTCRYCKSLFQNSVDLQLHEGKHRVVADAEIRKNCICRYCGKVFTQPSNAKRHERSHMTKKRFHCQFCAKSFSRPDNLKKHLTSHGYN